MLEGGLTLFISYAHEDESYRKNLEKHLTGLKRDGLIEQWHDRLIMAGQDWEKEINTVLDRSHIILFLVSPDFMASSYCNEVEVKRAMQRHEMGTARVIPVLIRPSDWKTAPFAKLQVLPTDAQPISSWMVKDDAFVDVVGHLRQICTDVASIPGNPANPYVTAEVGDWVQMETIIDLHTAAETKIASMRLTLVTKDETVATVQAEINSPDIGNDVKELKIPLDIPLEDSMGSLVGSVSEQIPANATIEVRQTGGGTEKLFIGGNTYYTTWITSEVEIRVGRDRLLQKSKKWLSSVIPLDGIVKFVLEIPGLMTQTNFVTAYGRRR